MAYWRVTWRSHMGRRHDVYLLHHTYAHVNACAGCRGEHRSNHRHQRILVVTVDSASTTCMMVNNRWMKICYTFLMKMLLVFFVMKIWIDSNCMRLKKEVNFGIRRGFAVKKSSHLAWFGRWKNKFFHQVACH